MLTSGFDTLSINAAALQRSRPIENLRAVPGIPADRRSARLLRSLCKERSPPGPLLHLLPFVSSKSIRINLGGYVMKIREFYSIFSSEDESSVLFAVLKKVSLLEGIASMAVEDMMWAGWPPEPAPGDGSLPVPSLVEA